MTSPSRWLSILGIGEDGVEGMTPTARAVLGAAEIVYGGARHLSLARGLITGEGREWPSPLSAAFPELLRLRPRAVAVLASGDPYCFGIGARLAKLVPAEETLAVPAPSSFSLACARLGWSLPDVATVSLCGRPLAGLIPHLQPSGRVLVLSADGSTPGSVADLLRARGFGGSRLQVMEALGGPRERVRSFLAADWLPGAIDPLNL
ncbi:MAG TPA: precorrin-6y C5,15-methyltransferase (decarboxylating) subunit CbiE, partial [Acetobacteraceae bacterium]|nr:precorrin-6y C5,15-methyltransferase (decarboxylating) subunit CbiE [Acetobacteraceae bacterium]